MAHAGVGYTGEAFIPNDQDLKELLALVDFRIQRTQSVFDAHRLDVPVKDGAWPVEWALLLARVADAKIKAAPETRPMLWTVHDSYEAVSRAVQQVDRTRTKGDLGDLMARLGKMGFPVDETGTPQPSPSNEPALQFLKWTNEVPTPGETFTGLKWAALVFFAWKTGLLDKLFK